MKRKILCSVMGLMVFTLSVAAQQVDIQRAVNQILNGKKLNALVTIYGVIEKLELNKADNTIAYELKDDWGDRVTVISRAGHPETNKRYRVEGYVAYDPPSKKYIVMETNRLDLTPKPVLPPAPVVAPPTSTPIPPTPTLAPTSTPAPTPTPKPTPEPTFLDTVGLGQGADTQLILLIGAVIVVLIVLIVVLLRNKQTSSAPDFDATTVVTMADKTQKITAAVASESAVQSGTVKVMPGRFEVVGGVELKEIRLIRPRGVPDHQIEYTFGRLPGDKITHIQLNDPTVSSRQARLEFRDGKFILVNIPDPSDPDRNAIILNGAKMNVDENRELQDGDKIDMGHVQLVYHVK